jgi:hypothetical protein
MGEEVDEDEEEEVVVVGEGEGQKLGAALAAVRAAGLASSIGWIPIRSRQPLVVFAVELWLVRDSRYDYRLFFCIILSLLRIPEGPDCSMIIV